MEIGTHQGNDLLAQSWMPLVHHIQDGPFFSQIDPGIVGGKLLDGSAVMKDVPVFDGLGEGRDATQAEGFQAMSFSAVEAGAEVLFVSVGEIHHGIGHQHRIHLAVMRAEEIIDMVRAKYRVFHDIVEEGSQDGLVFRQVGLDHFSDGDRVGPVGFKGVLPLLGTVPLTNLFDGWCKSVGKCRSHHNKDNIPTGSIGSIMGHSGPVQLRE